MKKALVLCSCLYYMKFPTDWEINFQSFSSLTVQEVGDARKIRNKILSNFELATQPSVSSEESKRLLHIVIVGGGPTGVEFGAEIYDFVEQVFSTFIQWKK